MEIRAKVWNRDVVEKVWTSSVCFDLSAPRVYWMDGAMILPVVVHLFEIKRLILYSPIHQAPGGYRYRTTVMSYVERGKVTQVATDGIAPPSSDDDVCIVFNGTNHFKWLKPSLASV